MQNTGVQHINFVQEEYVMKREKRDSYAGGAYIRDGDFQGRGEEGREADPRRSGGVHQHSSGLAVQI